MSAKKRAKGATFTGKVEVFPQFSMHYLEIPALVVRTLGGKFQGRYVCTLNGKISFQCGLLALGGGKGFIMLSKKRLSAANVKKGSRVKAKLEPDSSRYGAEVPKELREIFRQDKEGKRRFDALSAGKQRTILHYVASVKSPERRVDRALQMLGNLKALPEGKEPIRDLFRKDPLPPATPADGDLSQYATWDELKRDFP